MDEAGQRPPGTIGALWAATEITIGAEPKQLELWPTAQPTTNASVAAVGREELCAASYDDSGPTRASDQRAKPRLLPMILPPRASSCDPEIRAPRRDAFTLAAASVGAPWLHPALVTGALAVALGVGWIVGTSSSRFFAPAPAATPGIGRIDSIVRWGSRWIVATTKGLISTQNWSAFGLRFDPHARRAGAMSGLAEPSCSADCAGLQALAR